MNIYEARTFARLNKDCDQLVNMHLGNILSIN